MATEYELTLADYLSIMRRRAPYLAGTFLVVALIAVKVAFSIPPTYRSTGTIMVESPVVASGSGPGAIRNDLDERINIIKQRVMARDNLLQLVKKYGLFKDSIASMTTTDLVEKMRARIAVEPINSNTDDGGQQTIAFKISFDDGRPDVALKVASDLVTRFLQLNQRESLRATARSDLYDVERNIRSTSDDVRNLEAELSSANARHGISGLTAASSADVGGASQMLQVLKADYAKLSAVYTEAHPDVKALKRKIMALEQESRTAEPAAPRTAIRPTANFSSEAYVIRVKLDAANAKLASLMLQKRMLQDRIAQVERAIEQTPGAAQDGAGDAAAGGRDESRDPQTASAAQGMDSVNKSERFSLLEAPILPDRPYKPNRPKIVAMGVFLAMALSGGVVMALEGIDQRIRGTEALAHVLGSRPLVVIPFLRLEQEDRRRRRMFKWSLSAAGVVLIGVLAGLHFLYMPLGTLFVKILANLA